MKGRLLFSIFLLIVPGVAHAGHRRTEDFSSAIARSAAYEGAIRDAAARYSVDPRLLWTVAYLESRFRPRLVSHKGARGMMQFMPATGRRYGLTTLRDFHDPTRSVEAAAIYLSELNAMFNDRIDLVLAGYNAGENAVIAFGYRVPPYHETRSYVARGVSVLSWLVQGKVLSGNTSNQIRPATQTKQRFSAFQQNSLHETDPPKAPPARSIYFPK